MKVEELSQYGKTLSSLPKEAIKKQKSIVFQKTKNKLGFFGLIPFMIKMLFEQKTLKSKYPMFLKNLKINLAKTLQKNSHRKGTAPEYEVIDGRKVKWDVSFNK